MKKEKIVSLRDCFPIDKDPFFIGYIKEAYAVPKDKIKPEWVDNDYRQIGIRNNMKVAAQIERVQVLMDEILQVHLPEGHAFKIVIEGKRSKVESVRAGMVRKTQNGRWVEEIECWKGGKCVDGGMG